MGNDGQVVPRGAVRKMSHPRGGAHKDVDTTAPMAGAISGTRVRLEGLPPELARRVNDQGTWGYEELVCLVEDALEVCMGLSR